MCYAARTGSIPVLEHLHQSGGKLHSQDHEMRSPLHIAACYNHREIVQYLVSRGTSLDLLDYNGETPLFQAVLRGNYEVAEILREKGASARATNEEMIAVLNR